MVYAEWVESVNDVVKVNLERPLLIRAKKSNCISVNFNPQVQYWVYHVMMCVVYFLWWWWWYGLCAWIV